MGVKILVLLLSLVLSASMGCASMQEAAGPWVKAGMGALGEFSISTSALKLGPVGFTYGLRDGRIHGGFDVGAVPLLCLALGVVPDMKAAMCQPAAVMPDGTAHHAPWSLPQSASAPVDPERPPNRSPDGEIVAYNAFSEVGAESPQDWHPRLE